LQTQSQQVAPLQVQQPVVPQYAVVSEQVVIPECEQLEPLQRLVPQYPPPMGPLQGQLFDASAGNRPTATAAAAANTVDSPPLRNRRRPTCMVVHAISRRLTATSLPPWRSA
jgi:hypothetical protein